MSDRIVVGVDGGGTSTTVAVADLDGRLLGRADGGGASPEHNPMRVAHDTVRETIRAALADADRDVAAIAALTAGLAGLNDERDRQWATGFVTLPGLQCEPVCVNDAVVAHAGVLAGEPGIVVICGTGSIVFGIDDSGRQVRNYDLDHYAEAAARHLGRRLVHRLLGGTVSADDRAFVDEVLSTWNLDSVDNLQRAALAGDLLASDESGNALDRVAPTITAAAADGAPLAQTVCREACQEVVTGIRAVAGCLEAATPTTVALEGSVATSQFMRECLHEHLAAATESYDLVAPRMEPAAGDVVLGLQRLGQADPETIERLQSTTED